MNISYLLVFFQFFSLSLLFIPKSVATCLLLSTISLLCLTLSLALLVWTSKHNKVGNFNIIPDIKENAKLIKTGPYSYIRHPMYTSVVLIGLSALVYNFTYIKILIFVFLIVVLVLKAKREESFWCEENEGYKDYILNTKMFIPFVL